MYRDIILPTLAIIAMLFVGATIMFYHPEKSVSNLKIERLK